MAALSEADIQACVHPRQFPRFLLAFLFCLALAPLLAGLALVFTAVLALPLIVLAVWLVRETMFARYKGNAVMVSELNYPRIHRLTLELKETLGVSRDIVVFVYEQGNFNAFLMRLFFRRAVFLNSEILETGVSDDEVRWIVGRFVGYLRAQRRAGPAGWLIHMVQLLGFTSLFTLPYDRAMVYTGDRLALAAIGGDISTAASAMQKLLVGRQLGYSVNPVGLVEQHRAVKGSIFAFWARLPSPFPHATARYVDLLAFAKRHFADQFARFEAANPGLATDIDWLSSEYSSPADFAKGLAIYGGLILVFIAAYGFDILVYGGMMLRAEQGAQARQLADGQGAELGVVVGQSAGEAFEAPAATPTPDTNTAVTPSETPAANASDQTNTDLYGAGGETPSPAPQDQSSSSGGQSPSGPQ
jgi:hypothetical protein